MTWHVRCPECQSEMVLRDSRHGKFYGCTNYPKCTGTHGAHPNGAPMGFPGNAATKAARVRAHAAFDTLWKSGQMSRREAYRWMQTAMAMTKRQSHIGKFTVEQCDQLIARIGEIEN